MTQESDFLRAIDHIGVHDYRTILQYIADRKVGAVDQAIKGTGNTDVSRGRAQVWMELEELIKNATALVARLEKHNGKSKSNNSGYPGSS